jgi:hypothetical protein
MRKRSKSGPDWIKHVCEETVSNHNPTEALVLDKAFIASLGAQTICNPSAVLHMRPFGLPLRHPILGMLVRETMKGRSSSSLEYLSLWYLMVCMPCAAEEMPFKKHSVGLCYSGVSGGETRTCPWLAQNGASVYVRAVLTDVLREEHLTDD